MNRYLTLTSWTSSHPDFLALLSVLKTCFASPENILNFEMSMLEVRIFANHVVFSVCMYKGYRI